MRNGTGIATIAIMLLTGTAIAQSASVYKTKCQSCHGATGKPSAAMMKSTGVKPVTDPEVKAMTEEQMIAITTNGEKKMPAFKGKLTDAQIKQAVAQYRKLIK